jgi:hypothetical protein
MCHNRTRAPQQTSGRAFPVVSFMYLSVAAIYEEGKLNMALEMAITWIRKWRPP